MYILAAKIPFLEMEWVEPTAVKSPQELQELLDFFYSLGSLSLHKPMPPARAHYGVNRRATLGISTAWAGMSSLNCNAQTSISASPNNAVLCRACRV